MQEVKPPYEAGDYYTDGIRLLRTAQYDSALIYLNEAGFRYREAEEWTKYVECLNQIGFTYRLKADFSQAITILESSISIARSKLGRKHAALASGYMQLGNVFIQKGDYKQALKLHNRALSIQLETLGENHALVGKSYHNIGWAYHEKADYDRALSFYEKALSIWKDNEDDPLEQTAKTYNNMGNVYIRKGDYKRALEFHTKALTIKQENIFISHPSIAATYGNLGLVNFEKGDYSRALELHLKALNIRQILQGADHPDHASAYNNIANIYLQQGEYEHASAYYQKAITIKRRVLGENHKATANTYYNLGRIHLLQGDYEQAIIFHNEALRIRKRVFGPQSFHIATIYYHLSEVYRQQSQEKKALDLLFQALAIQKAAEHPDIVKSLNRLGDHYQEKGDYDQALEYYQRALQSNSPTFSSPSLAQNPPLENVFYDQSLLHSLQHKAETLILRASSGPDEYSDLDIALSTYLHAATLIDRIRRSYKSEEAKFYLAENTAHLYRKGIHTALRLLSLSSDNKYKQAAFFFAEKGKTGILLDAISEAKAKQFAGIPDSLLEREHQLRVDIAFYERNLAQQRISENPDSANVVLWQNKALSLKQNYETLLQHFENTYPAYFNLKYQVHTATVEEVQESLPEQTALIEYVVDTDSLFIFTLTPDSYEITTVATDSSLENNVRLLRDGLVGLTFGSYLDPAYQLYRTLIAPIAAHIKDRQLIIIADNFLHYLPFEALLTHEVDSTKTPRDYRYLPYFIEQHAISYNYSATLRLQTLRRVRKEPERDYLAFAPVFFQNDPDTSNAKVRPFNKTFSAKHYFGGRSLSLSRDEVIGIRKLFAQKYGLLERLWTDKIQVYMEEDAHEEQVKNADLASYRYVHFATHGFSNEDEPALSGLTMAPRPESEEDGVLYLAEVYTLNLNADLVVLSACETAIGKNIEGEGIISLTRGFLYAGASNMLVSVWKVQDKATRNLMIDFYQKMLRDGLSRTEALQATKIAAIHENAWYARPFYWASFTLVGT